METLKYILEYLGLISATVFGILATVFETHTTYIDSSSGTQVEKKKINTWGKWAIVGVCLSFIISGASKLVQSEIDRIADVKKELKDSTDRKFQDSLIFQTNSVSNNLHTSLDITSAQSDSLGKMISILGINNIKQDINIIKQDTLIKKTGIIMTRLDSADVKQNSNLERQKDILARTQLMMHPLFPLQFHFSLQVNLDSLNQNVHDEMYDYIHYFRSNEKNISEPAYFRLPHSREAPTHLIYYPHFPFEAGYTKTLYDNNITKLETFVYSNFIPRGVVVSISHTTEYGVGGEQLTFCLTPREVYDNVFRIENVSFDLMCDDRNGKEYNYCNVSFSINAQACPVGFPTTPYSLLQYSNGHIYVTLQPLLVDDLTKWEENGAKINLTSFSINCGPNYSTKYVYSTDETNLINQTSDKKYEVNVSGWKPGF